MSPHVLSPGCWGAVAHLPIEFIVVIMDIPPEVEPGECEAEGEGEQQEPETLPLEEQRARGVKVVRDVAQVIANRNQPPSPSLSPDLPGRDTALFVLTRN